MAINTSGSMEIEDWAYFLKYDSDYGVWEPEIKVSHYRDVAQTDDEFPEIGTLEIDGHVISLTAQRDPAKIPWDRYQVQVVIESTGIFRTAKQARAHFHSNIDHVILSAPGKGEGIATTVLGVDQWEDIYQKDTVSPGKTILSNASCTTNSVAPVAQVIHEHFGIKKAALTTIHAYTDDQNIKDNSHKKLTRGRGAAQNIVPTTTGAAQATAAVIPDLNNVFDGMALRVPVSVGSISDLTFIVEKPTNPEEVNEVLQAAAKSARYQNILAVTKEPLVSRDIVGRPESSIVDLNFTKVIDGDLVKILTWYDNEWGYCNRLLDLVSGIMQ